MYFLLIILLMFVFPSISVLAELFVFKGNPEIILTLGKWFVFWMVGARLFLAGLRQSVTPRFTAEKIFDFKTEEPLPIIRELGFANLSIGALGLTVIFQNSWIMPAAVTGGLFYGFASLMHLTEKNRNRIENFAMVSDLWAFAVLLAYCVVSIARS